MNRLYQPKVTPCYSARKDLVADQEEDSNSQKPPSPSGSDFRNPIQQESEYDHQLLVLTKEVRDTVLGSCYEFNVKIEN